MPMLPPHPRPLTPEQIRQRTFRDWDGTHTRVNFIRAASYTVEPQLFPEVAPVTRADFRVGKGARALSPSGLFTYTNRIIPAGHFELCFRQNAYGLVCFDEDIALPVIHEGNELWMSLSPQEYLTLDIGLKHARGHTVVAGLGLGYQLMKVTHRPRVKRVTLIERSNELVDWILPRLRPHLHPDVQLDVIVGDAYTEMPKLKADAALVDVFPLYGNNDDEMTRLRASCDRIKVLWGWGAFKMTWYEPFVPDFMRAL